MSPLSWGWRCGGGPRPRRVLPPEKSAMALGAGLREARLWPAFPPWSSPRWVVGRTVAIYQMVTFGGMAIGSWLSGLVADRFGLVTCLVASGLLMCLSALLGRALPLHQPEGLNLDPSRTWSAENRAQL